MIIQLDMKGKVSMKIRKWLCCILATAMSSLIVFSGCSTPTGENSNILESSLQSSTAESSNGLQESSEPEISDESSGEGSKEENSSVDEQITPAMWKVTSPNGDYMYMMGSIHLADESVNYMPDYFEEIYSECDALAFEVDINAAMEDLSSSALSTVSKMMYTDGTTIKDHISEDTYNKAVKLLKENNIYNSAFDYCIPYMWASLIESIVYEKSGLDASYGVDTVLIDRAKEDGKEVLEVESFEMQMELLTGFSDELQEIMLQAYLVDGVIDEQVEAMNELYEKWKSGTITAEDVSDETDDESLTAEEKELLDEYNNEMVYERNIGMADKSEEYIQSDNTVLMIVGAAHFYGDKGILKLMEDRGYTVTQITSVDVLAQTSSETANAA